MFGPQTEWMTNLHMSDMTSSMANSKKAVTVSVDTTLLWWADQLVQEGAYESRSAAVEAALEALHRYRLDAQLEAALATEGPADVAEGAALAELGVAEWASQLDALDGGYGGEHAPR